jgi:hypothetical protein
MIDKKIMLNGKVISATLKMEPIIGKWLVREIFVDKDRNTIPNKFGRELKMTGTISDILNKKNGIRKWGDIDGHQIDLIKGNRESYSEVTHTARVVSVQDFNDVFSH